MFDQSPNLGHGVACSLSQLHWVETEKKKETEMQLHQ